jgi:hypothetical protein
MPKFISRSWAISEEGDFLVVGRFEISGSRLEGVDDFISRILGPDIALDLG